MDRIAAAVQSGVPWDGAVNVWHIAGRVYRMGRREWLTEAGWRQMYDAGIRTVIDLRNDWEQSRRDADPVVADGATVGFDIVSCPTEVWDNEEFRRICGPYLNDPVCYADNARLFPERLAAVFKTVATARGGVVLHCSAGRDRSGMIGAMLQDLAGAPDEDIVRGYQQGMRGINDRHRHHPAPHTHEKYLDEAELEPLLQSRGEKALVFVRTLDTAAFLTANGVSEVEIAAVRKKLNALAD